MLGIQNSKEGAWQMTHTYYIDNPVLVRKQLKSYFGNLFLFKRIWKYINLLKKKKQKMKGDLWLLHIIIIENIDCDTSGKYWSIF